jgi:SagB-type dehydrogenase family enzyme
MDNKILRKLQNQPSGVEDFAWEWFHENSKIGRYDPFPPAETVLTQMSRYFETLSFPQYPEFLLSDEPAPLTMPLEKAIANRVSTRELKPDPLSLPELTAILHYSYGINRDNKDTGYPRPFRNIPSGGALYPLDVFFHGSAVQGLEKGIYHYNPLTHSLRLVHPRNETPKLARALVQPELAYGSSVMFFITAQFERSYFKYRDRSYRFILLEAGHLAQNINLSATALGLGCVNIGGYFDRDIDELLGLDGLTQSTLYLTAVGRLP